MSLRRRLGIALLFVVITFVAFSAIITRSHQSFLVDQVDQGLERIRPVASLDPQSSRPPPGGEAFLTGPAVSNIYVGALDRSGRETVYVSGDLLSDLPLLSSTDSLAASLDSGAPFTVKGVAGRSRFRVIGIPRPAAEGWTVAALPLDATDEAVTRLKVALALAGLALLTALALISWWVERLGLRPVARLTKTAESITAGDRSQRVKTGDPNTEAGQLAVAFNQMLDQRDQSEEKLRCFVSDASHELRTPLTSIRGYLDLYASGGLDEQTALDDAVRRMTQESARMQDLVEDLLLMANLDQHRPLSTESVDLAVLLEDAALDARARQPGRVATVTTTKPLLIDGDPARLRQLIGNLVANALTHTGPHVPVGLIGSVVDGRVLLIVEDHGPGLDPAVAERVFDRFYRGDASRDRNAGGAGLGLAIAQSIAEAHGGMIRLDTAPGQGCRFTVALPAPKTDRANS